LIFVEDVNLNTFQSHLHRLIFLAIFDQAYADGHPQVSRNNDDNEQAIESVKKLYAVVESEQAFLVHGHDSEQWWELKNHHPILRVPQP
jgi:hypothetical protein